MSAITLDTPSAMSLSNTEPANYEPEKVVWEGRQWAFLGPKANIPAFIHRLFALTSASIDAFQSLAQTIQVSAFQTAGGALLHAKNLFEGCRKVIDYTNIVNTIYRAKTEGPLYFVAKEKKADGTEQVDILKTAANACFVALSIIAPMDFILTRVREAGVLTSTNISRLQEFIKAGPQRTHIFDVFASAWLLGTGLNLFISLKSIHDSMHKVMDEEQKNKPEASLFENLQVAWDKGVTWGMLNDLQLKFVDFGFSCFAGGMVPFPANALTKACGIAFKAMAGFNGVTQIFLGKPIQAQLQA